MLETEQLESLVRVADRLADMLSAHSTSITGVSGAPGSGKSTLCRVLCDRLQNRGIAALTLSLDDYYLDRGERAALAAEVHPLLATRGVPGTHHIVRLIRDMQAIIGGDAVGLRLRRFDKSSDSSLPRAQWPTIDRQPRHLFVEGWCVGARVRKGGPGRPGPGVNADDDTDAAWQRWVDEALAGYQRRLWVLLERFWYIAVPGWKEVVDWRWQQEKTGGSELLTDRTAVEAFLASYRRIVTDMLGDHRQWADVGLTADPDHRLDIAWTRT